MVFTRLLTLSIELSDRWRSLKLISIAQSKTRYNLHAQRLAKVTFDVTCEGGVGVVRG